MLVSSNLTPCQDGRHFPYTETIFGVIFAICVHNLPNSTKRRIKHGSMKFHGDTCNLHSIGLEIKMAVDLKVQILSAILKFPPSWRGSNSICQHLRVLYHFQHVYKISLNYFRFKTDIPYMVMGVAILKTVPYETVLK